MTPESLIFCKQLAAIKSISDLESLEILVGRLMSCFRSEYLNSDLRADVSKYRPEVYKSEKSKILKKIHKVALGKLLT